MFKGLINLTGNSSDLEHLIIEGNTGNQHKYKVYLKHILYQPDYGGTDYENGASESPVICICCSNCVQGHKSLKDDADKDGKYADKQGLQWRRCREWKNFYDSGNDKLELILSHRFPKVTRNLIQLNFIIIVETVKVLDNVYRWLWRSSLYETWWSLVLAYVQVSLWQLLGRYWRQLWWILMTIIFKLLFTNVNTFLVLLNRLCSCRYWQCYGNYQGTHCSRCAATGYRISKFRCDNWWLIHCCLVELFLS